MASEHLEMEEAITAPRDMMHESVSPSASDRNTGDLAMDDSSEAIAARTAKLVQAHALAVELSLFGSDHFQRVQDELLQKHFDKARMAGIVGQWIANEMENESLRF